MRDSLTSPLARRRSNTRKVGAGGTAIEFAFEARSKPSLNCQGVRSALPARKYRAL